MYVPSPRSPVGHLVFLRDATLYSQAFDEHTLRLQGEPVSLTMPVGSFLDSGFFAVSQTDVIVVRPPDKDFQLTWLDRRGQKTGTVGDVGRYTGVALSRDDGRVATSRETVGGNTSQDIWVHEIARPTSKRVTTGPLLGVHADLVR